MVQLSVVMAIRNTAPYLPLMIASIERNLDVDVEIIAVDDASTDATSDLLEAASRRLRVLRTIRTPDPVGAATARNLGLDQATGRLITFLDGDDWIVPGHFRTLIEAIDGLDCDMVRTDHVQVMGRDRQVHRAPGPHNVVLAPRGAIMPLNRETMVDYPFSWAGVYKASLGPLLRWVDGLHTATDRPWIWQLHREAGSFATVSHAGVYYRRQVAGALTAIGDERRLHLFDAYRAVFAQVDDEPDVLPKAVRQFLGLIARHITMFDVYEAEPRRRFEELARTALAAIDPDVYERAVMPDDRRELLEPYRTAEPVV